MTTTVRRMLVMGTGAIAVVLAAAMAAWACTSLATLDFEPEEAAPGEEVTVTGENFQAPGIFPDELQPVKIRFGSLVGPVLATTTPDGAGDIEATFEVPDVDFGGQYVIVATQLTSEGEPSFGTPARAAMRVEAPGEGPAVAPQPAAQPEEAPLAAGAEVSPWTWVMLALIGITALALLGGGLGLFVREIRTRRAVVPERAE